MKKMFLKKPAGLGPIVKAMVAGLFLLLLCLPMTGSAAPLRESATEDEPATYTIFLPQVINVFPWHGNPFGIESERDITSGLAEQRIIELNPGWMRMNRRISWRDLQPEEGGPIQWDLLADFETELAILKTQGIQPIVIVDDSPRWATIEPNACSPLREDKFAAFATFMEALVDRYSNPTFNLYNWELGNEVDIDRRLVAIDSHYGCWGNIDDLEYYGGDYYGEMIKVVGAAIKARNPKATVWLGGLMIATPLTTNPVLGKPENFLRGILAVGAAPYFDYVSYHGHQSWYGSRLDPVLEYEGGAWEPYQGVKSNFIREILQEYGVDKRLFLTEAGVGCADWLDQCASPPEEFFQFQADQGIRTIVRVVSSGTDGFIWYQLTGPGWRYSTLLNGQYEPQPIYIAYQQLIAQTWMHDLAGQVSYGAGLDAYEFRKGNQRTHIVWTNRDDIIPIQIPANEFMRAVDRDGNPITPVRNGGYVTLVASYAPIYVVLGPKLSQASTLWPQDGGSGDHEVALFRKEFTLSEGVTDLSLSIFADTRYELWLDGEWLGRGPARFSTQTHEYDLYAIDKLSTGVHSISALVAWAPNTRRSESTAPGLMVQAVGWFTGGARFAIASDGSWKATTAPAWSSTARPIHTEELIGPTEILDLSKLPADWFTQNFVSDDWPQAEIRAGPSADATLQPRTLPFLQNTIITPTLVGLGNSPKSTLIDIPPGQQTQFEQSFSLPMTGTLSLRWVNESHHISDRARLNGAPIAWNPAPDHPDRFIAALTLAPGSHRLTVDGIDTDGLTLHLIWPEGATYPQTPIVQHDHTGRRSLSLDLPPLAAPQPITGPLTFTPAGGPAFLILDLGQVRTGRAEVDISGPAGTMVDIGWDEGLNARPLPYPGSLYEQWNQVDSWTLDGGNHQLRTLDARTGRYLYVTIWNLSGDVIVHNVRMIEERYPVREVGTFRSSDPLLNQIWRIGMETAKINMTDAYADPWRERGQWWGDTFMVDLTNRVTFGDTGLLRRGLVFMAEAFQQGSMVGIAPQGGNSNMRDYAMLWVHNLEDYARLTGDIWFLRDNFATLVDLLDRLKMDADPVSGLLNPPLAHWNQTAYVDTWAGYGYSRDGQSAALNAIYYATLERAAAIARTLDETDFAAAWTAQGAAVKASVNGLLLDESGRYAATRLAGEALPSTLFSQAWPLAYNMTPEPLVNAAIAYLGPMISSEPRSPNIGVYGLYWVAHAYANNGYLSEALDLIRLYYGSMIDRGATTWWERPDADQFYWAAKSHGWGSWPTWLLSTRVLGAQWTGPDAWSFVPPVAQLAGDVDHATGVIPVSGKPLSVAWQVTECDQAIAQLNAPAQTTGVVRFDKATTQTLAWNQQTVWDQGTALSPFVSVEDDAIVVQISQAGGHSFFLAQTCQGR